MKIQRENRIKIPHTCNASKKNQGIRKSQLTDSIVSRGINFLRRQPHDWQVTVTRTALASLCYQIICPYGSVYIIALGATAVQLGIVNSIGMCVAGLMSPLIGCMIDRFNIKRIYLIAIGLLLVSYLTFGLALSWGIIIFAMVAYWLGSEISGHCCATVCGKCLVNRERATGMTFCETLSSGVLGIGGPMLGALLVSNFGGVNVHGIRPLFFIALAGTGVTFLLIYFYLSADGKIRIGGYQPRLFKDISQVVTQGCHLKRWLIIDSVGFLPFGMLFPFSPVFAHEIKGADQYVLGMMVTGSALTLLMLGIPIGRLADKIGRKRVLYIILPLFWSSNLVLIGSPNPGFLIFAGVLQGFHYIDVTVAEAMTFELVPSGQMGRWLGLIKLCRLLLGACTAFMAGIIWDTLGPQYVFLTVMGLDILIRLPLLVGMPETLDLEKQTELS